jgi:hypothetical protein
MAVIERRTSGSGRGENINSYGRRIFAWLLEHRGEQFRFGALCHEIGVPTSKATKAAIGRVVAPLAEQAGLYLTVPCPANDWTIALSDEIGEWPRPDKQLRRIQDGIERRREQGFSFAQQNVDQLDASQGALLRAIVGLKTQKDANQFLLDQMLDDLAETIS